MVFALLIPAGLTVWLRFVEERELVQRFGERYDAYRRATPAFWPKLRDLPHYWKFLLRGG
jgi:protein-S-isoprenylcysteine O-methyltransferase Ste14